MGAVEIVRLRNINSGAVMSTAAENAVRLGSEWIPFDGSSTNDGAAEGYSSLKVGDLKEEIEKRNVDREDDAKLSTDGKKADLIATLEADDQAQPTPPPAD